MAAPLSRRRQIARVNEIARVAAKHGFGFAFERGPLHRRPPAESPSAVGRHLRETLDELGPTFVKFGQLLSTRPDVVPPEVAAELRQLQDHVTPVSLDAVREVIRTELNADVEDVFAHFDDEPVAAASIGQVHLAELPTGRRVAVKVQRPNAPAQIDADIALLYQVARIVGDRVERLQFVDTVALVDEFARSIRNELDYRIEARNADAFRRNFAEDRGVVIPKVYWTYSSARVLTLERLEGTKLGDLDYAGLEMAERKRLANALADAWLTMIFRHGMFHADPHPANIFVLPDSRLGLVDFGIVGTLNAQDMRKLTRLFVDAVNENIDALPRRLRDLGVRFNSDQEEEFRVELREVFYRYHGAAIGEIDPLEVVREAFGLISRMHLRLPTRYALLDKTLATLSGVGAELYPDFNVFEVAEPYAHELVASQFKPGALVERGREELASYGGMLMELPYQVHDTLEQVRDGEIEIGFRHQGLNDLIAKGDIIANRLCLAIVMAGALIASGLVAAGVKAGPELWGINLLAWIGVGFAAFLGMLMVGSIVRSGRF